MRYFFTFLILFILILIQVSFLPVFISFDLLPNLVLIYVFSHHLVNPSRSSLSAGVLGGLFLDLTQPGLVGASSLAIILILILAQFSLANLGHSFFRALVLLGLASILLRVLVDVPSLDFRFLAIGVLLDWLLFILVFPLVKRTHQTFSGRPLVGVKIK